MSVTGPKGDIPQALVYGGNAAELSVPDQKAVLTLSANSGHLNEITPVVDCRKIRVCFIASAFYFSIFCHSALLLFFSQLIIVINVQ